ncbi:MAG: hypothetical protein MHM6MM_004907 [Cercozoa sp. M6MM]
MYASGIDFGNDACVVAATARGSVQIVTNEVTRRRTPTMVGYNANGGKQRNLGESAMSGWRSNVKTTLHDLKLILGRQYDAQPTHDFLQQVSFASKKAADGTVLVSVRHLGEQLDLKPEQVMGALLASLGRMIEKSKEGRPLSDIVLSCPAWYTQQQRQALLNAAKIAGLNVSRLMNDTAALALQYGILRQLPKDETVRIAFADIGHSDANISIVDFTAGKLSLVASINDESVSARQLDDIVLAHAVQQIQQKYNMDVRTNKRALLRLRTEAIKLKKVISANTEAFLNAECLMNDTDVSLKMTRDELEQAAAPMLERLRALCVKALACTEGTPLTAIEAVGGCVRVPSVQKVLRDAFKMDLSFTCNGDESVAMGCALQCAMLSPGMRVRPFEVQDITPYSVTLQYSINEASKESELFRRFHAAPSVKSISFPVSADEPTKIALSLRYTNPENLPDGVQPHIGSYEVVVPPIAEADQGIVDPEKRKLKVKVKLDLHGVISVTDAELTEVLLPQEEPEQAPMEDAEVEATADAAETADKKKEQEAAAAQETEKKKRKKRRSTLVMTCTARCQGYIDDKSLHEMRELELQHEAQDRLVIETLACKNDLESYVYEMRDNVEYGLKPFMKDDVREAFVEQCKKIEFWLDEDGWDATKSEYVKRLQSLRQVGDAAVQRKREFDGRNDAIANLSAACAQAREMLQSTDEQHAHIGADVRDPALQQVADTENFLQQALEKQQTLTRADEPVFRNADLINKAQQLLAKAQQVMSTPKPAPPKEEKKPEETPMDTEEEGSEEVPMQDDESEPAAE